MPAGPVVGRTGTGGGASLWDDPVLVLYRQGVEALDGGDFLRARKIAARAVAECPEQFLAHDLLGRAAFACGNLEEAAAAFGEVLRSYPNSFAALRHLGVAQERLGRAEDACRTYAAALRLRPDCAEIRRRLQRLTPRRAAVTAASGAL